MSIEILRENKYQLIGLGYALLVYFHRDREIVTVFEMMKQVITGGS